MPRSIAKDHDDKRRAILKTAARFFARNGYDRASMSQLALECGVSKALIYHYYSAKEALLFDILDNHLGALLAHAGAVEREAKTPEQYLRSLVSAILASYKDADNEHRLQLEAMAALPDAQRNKLAGIQKQLVQVVAEAIRDVEPELFEVSPQYLRPVTMSLFGMLNWFYLWYRKGKGITRQGYAEMATDILLGGLRSIAEKQGN